MIWKSEDEGVSAAMLDKSLVAKEGLVSNQYICKNAASGHVGDIESKETKLKAYINLYHITQTAKAMSSNSVKIHGNLLRVRITKL